MINSKLGHAIILGIVSTIALYLVLNFFDEQVPVFNSAVRLMLAVLISGYLIYRFLYRKL
jgi:purine-cytosine permease-like protein